MSLAFDATLLSRVEDAGINASAPRQQRWIDGWLVRLARARRSAHGASTRLPPAGLR